MADLWTPPGAQLPAPVKAQPKEEPTYPHIYVPKSDWAGTLGALGFLAGVAFFLVTLVGLLLG